MITTGVRSAAPRASELQAGLSYREIVLDHVFTGLMREDGWARSSVSDPASRLRVEQLFDSSFRSVSSTRQDIGKRSASSRSPAYRAALT